jgi:hypothetical protein
MSRTKRNIPKERQESWGRNWRYEDGEFVGDATPWKAEKMGRHKRKEATRGGSKYKIGPGGINCRCCTKLPPEVIKVAIRRYERRKINQKKYGEEE